MTETGEAVAQAPAGAPAAAPAALFAGAAGGAPLAGGYLGPEARAAGFRVICFHHAGGGASGFRAWRGAFGPDTVVCPVQLPGRESRRGEPPFTGIGDLVADLDTELDPVLEDGPHLLFGHSMGALVAYRLALRRHLRGARPAAALAAACYPAPTRPSGSGVDAHWAVDDDTLADVLVGAGGMPAELLRHRSLLHAMLGLVRADLRVCATHRPDDAGELDIPLHVFGGRADALVAPASLFGWERCTRAGHTLRLLEGDHFFPVRAPDGLLAELVPLVAAAAAAA